MVAVVRVTTSEFIRDYGALSDRALTEPVTITKDGRDRLVLVSAEEYERLRLHARRAIGPEDLTEAEAAAIARAEVDPRHAHLDEELRGWSS
jgi:PHD/YefM family antitoxin component YafN of YafNO toxin-antitoxin module